MRRYEVESATTIDGEVILTCDIETGRWAYETRLRNSRTVRGGGVYKSPTRAEHLLAIALHAALSSMHRSRTERFSAERGGKPAFSITTVHPFFADKLMRHISGESPDDTGALLVPSWVMEKLDHKRRDIELVANPSPNRQAVLGLSKWLAASILDEQPSVLTAQVISETGDYTSKRYQRREDAEVIKRVRPVTTSTLQPLTPAY
jgi:hypothetical protein